MLSSEMVLRSAKEQRKDRIFYFFYLSIYIMASRKREGRGASSVRRVEKNRQTGMRVGSVAAPHESPSGRDAARVPKCPRGRTADSCWPQKSHTGGSLTTTYTMHATRLIRGARPALRVCVYGVSCEATACCVSYTDISKLRKMMTVSVSLRNHLIWI